ncbi:MAG: SOS response-associated peptidase family protein [Terracidiphilus sp.]|jgi:putative SOS response-associated peptidase YedK
MCGRYGRRADKQRIAEWMQAHNTGVFDDSYFAPSYNVAPQSFQPVVRLNLETGERELTVMRWGLIPSWILFRKSLLFYSVALWVWRVTA